jgi:hypothetical protein
MLRWGIALAAVGLLGVATQAQAQAPAGGNGLKFVPINTQNLSTPLPVPNIPHATLSRGDKIHNALASVVPWMSKRQPAVPAPKGVAARPKSGQNQLPQPQSPTFTLPELPKVPPVVSATIK